MKKGRNCIAAQQSSKTLLEEAKVLGRKHSLRQHHI